MKLLLVYPRGGPEPQAGSVGAIAEPLALCYLSRAAKALDMEVQALDERLDHESIEEVLARFKPDVVAATAMTMHVLRVVALCRTVKAVSFKIVTVVGGHHATVMPDDFVDAAVDIVVRGMGVGLFQDILGALKKGRCIEGVSGFEFRGDPTLLFSDLGASPRLDSLPFPDRSIFAKYAQHYHIGRMKPVALVRTSVGCPYRCKFCALWKIQNGKYLTHSIERTVNELRELEQEAVFFADDESFLQPTRMKKLALAIRSAGIRKRFFSYCRIDTIIKFPSLFSLWRDIGLEAVFVGIEDISPNRLEQNNKGIVREQIEQGLKIIEELGLQVAAGFIVNPNYTRLDFQRLKRFIHHHKLENPLFTVMTLLPGTAALDSFKTIIERQPSGRPNWDLFDLQHPVTETALPRQEFMAAYRELQRSSTGSLFPFSGKVDHSGQ